jgi:hypothetical protein
MLKYTWPNTYKISSRDFLLRLLVFEPAVNAVVDGAVDAAVGAAVVAAVEQDFQVLLELQQLKYIKLYKLFKAATQAGFDPPTHNFASKDITTRVTRLGEFLLIRLLFSLGRFFNY